jgi:chromate transporter
VSEPRTPSEAPTSSESAAAPRPSLPSLFLSFLRLGAASFGGPAMVAYIKRMAVTRKEWLPEPEFQQGVALCQAVPGATAMQCAAYVGWRVRGLAGAVCAYVGFGLPAFILMLSLSVAYGHAVHIGVVTSMLAGLRALVVALVANAVWTFGRSSIKGARHAALAVTTAGLFFVGLSPFVIVVGAGLAGSLLLPAVRRQPPPTSRPRASAMAALRAPAMVLLTGGILVASLLVLAPALASLGLVMMKVDVFAFGGGFASVPLMFREIVDARHWVAGNVFMDGIALGQVTPGPIVITATFVGYQAAGLAGAVVGTVCIFMPSLFTVVLVEPWFDRLRASPRFQAATQGLVVSFVGLLASVTVHFGRLVHWNLASTLLGASALTALLLKVDVLWVVLAGAIASMIVL